MLDHEPAPATSGTPCKIEAAAKWDGNFAPTGHDLPRSACKPLTTTGAYDSPSNKFKSQATLPLTEVRPRQHHCTDTAFPADLPLGSTAQFCLASAGSLGAPTVDGTSNAHGEREEPQFWKGGTGLCKEPLVPNCNREESAKPKTSEAELSSDRSRKEKKERKGKLTRKLTISRPPGARGQRAQASKTEPTAAAATAAAGGVNSSGTRRRRK